MKSKLGWLSRFLADLAPGVPVTALAQDFREVLAWRGNQEHAEDFEQFCDFMVEAKRCVDQEELLAVYVRASAIALATGAIEEDSPEGIVTLRLIRSRPHWVSQVEGIRRELAVPDHRANLVEMFLCRGKDELWRSPSGEVLGTWTVCGISPGLYTLFLATGWCVWEASLQSEDVEWSKAFAGRPVQLAADTEHTEAVSSREWLLLENTVSLRLFPGLETGRFEVSIHV